MVSRSTMNTEHDIIMILKTPGVPSDSMLQFAELNLYNLESIQNGRKWKTHPSYVTFLWICFTKGYLL